MSSPAHGPEDAPAPQSLVESDVRERAYVPELLKGLAITSARFVRNLFFPRDENPDVLNREGPNTVSTVCYPEEKVDYPPGYRGLHRLVPRDDGRPRCVACYLCATICPAQCIYIEAGEYSVDDDATQSRVIEKYPKQFVIDELRCVVCGLCVDACPKDAIRMDTGTHAPSEYHRQGFVYDIPKLLVGSPVSHASDPWFKRGNSAEPDEVAKEAHTRLDQPVRPFEVDTSGPVTVTKFFKR